MNMLVATANKLMSNKKYDTQFKVDNVKKELLLNKYKSLICESCVTNVKVNVKESHCQAIA
jgi:hypothetical protein